MQSEPGSASPSSSSPASPSSSPGSPSSSSPACPSSSSTGSPSSSPGSPSSSSPGSPSSSPGSPSSSPGSPSSSPSRPRSRASPPCPPPELGSIPPRARQEHQPLPASMIKGCQNECTGGGCSGDTGKQVIESFKASDLIITPATTFKEKPDPTGLVFGTVFTDNMLTIEWSLDSGWEKPYIKPLENLSLHPASSALHYAVELFEGMKAYRGVDGKIRLFRPTLNMDRMARSAQRTTLPSFDQNELLECIRKLVEVEQEWVPYSTSASLYIRPTLIGTEPSLGVKKPTKALLYVILSPVGAYFASGTFNPISLWADPKYVRAWKGGTGDCKVGGNYGSAIYAQQEALEFGCQQVLWLYGEDHQITEVGTMNLFLYWVNEDGENELATPPLDGIILPGVTRQSILDLARSWGEFKVSERYITMSDLTTALEENRVKEMFGAGTACIVCPISKILYKGKHLHIPTMENGPELTTRFLNKLSDIQYGREDSDWAVLVS